ncbi:MAG TPA: hypothetical protein DF296_11400, partial [Candidatus Margulisbacteria bacterium]|nr:hypothetical protein [Candidatus Margulisiibacteriota bacterium]
NICIIRKNSLYYVIKLQEIYSQMNRVHMNNNKTQDQPSTESQLSTRALERRIKRRFLKEVHSFFASCSQGFENILAQELKNIEGVTNLVIVEGGVEYSGELRLMYESNLRLRTANRILIRIASFNGKSYPTLFNKVRTKPWELYLGINPEININVTAKQSRLHHTGNIAKTITDGIKNYYQRFNQDISVKEDASKTIFVRFFDDACTISLDTSGEHLHKRGYKSHNVDAPIRETYAAGLLLKYGVENYNTIVDPFCGSGTLLFEAASIVHSVQAGSIRDFAFFDFAFFNKGLWEKIKKENPVRDIPTKIDHIRFFGFDIEEKAIEAARSNSKKLEMDELISFQAQDARILKNRWENKGLILANLPYGIRLSGKQEDIRQLYKDFGETLRNEFKGWTGLFISNSIPYLQLLPVKVKNSFQFSNGGIKVTAHWGSIK